MLSDLGKKVDTITFRSWTLLILLVLLLKSGIHPIGVGWLEIVKKASDSFPAASNYMSTSPLPIIIHKTLGDSSLVWWIFHALLFCLFLLISIWYASKSYPRLKRLSVALIFTSPTFLIVLLFIGHYDFFTIAGAALAIFAVSYRVKAFGVLLACLANPEQALVTSAILLTLFLVVREKQLLKIGILYSISAVTTFVLVRFVIVETNEIQRSSVILSQLELVIKSSASVWALLPFTVFGMTGIFILLNWQAKMRSKMIGLGITFGIPILLSLLILDKTRVGVAVSAAAMFYLVKQSLEDLDKKYERDKNQYFENLGLVSIFVFLVPSLYVDIGGDLRLPYKELLALLTN